MVQGKGMTCGCLVGNKQTDELHFEILLSISFLSHSCILGGQTSICLLMMGLLIEHGGLTVGYIVGEGGLK